MTEQIKQGLEGNITGTPATNPSGKPSWEHRQEWGGGHRPEALVPRTGPRRHPCQGLAPSPHELHSRHFILCPEVWTIRKKHSDVSQCLSLWPHSLSLSEPRTRTLKASRRGERICFPDSRLVAPKASSEKMTGPSRVSSQRLLSQLTHSSSFTYRFIYCKPEGRLPSPLLQWGRELAESTCWKALGGNWTVLPAQSSLLQLHHWTQLLWEDNPAHRLTTCSPHIFLLHLLGERTSCYCTCFSSLLTCTGDYIQFPRNHHEDTHG